MPGESLRLILADGFVAADVPIGRLPINGLRDAGCNKDSTSDGALIRGSKSADAVQHFRMFRESAGFLLAIDQLAIDFDVEDAPAALDEFGVDVELGLDRIRQTGGLGRVVSLYAIFNGNVHVGPLIRRSILLYRARGPPYNNIASATDQYSSSHANDSN